MSAPLSSAHSLNSVSRLRAELSVECGTSHVDMAPARFVSRLRDLRNFLKLRRIVHRERCDVMITFGTKAHTIGALPALRRRSPKPAVAVRGLSRILKTADR